MFEKRHVKFSEVEIDGEKYLVKDLSTFDMEEVFIAVGADFAGMSDVQDIRASRLIVLRSLHTLAKQPCFANIEELRSLNFDGFNEISKIVCETLGIGGTGTKKP